MEFRYEQNGKSNILPLEDENAITQSRFYLANEDREGLLDILIDIVIPEKDRVFSIETVQAGNPTTSAEGLAKMHGLSNIRLCTSEDNVFKVC